MDKTSASFVGTQLGTSRSEFIAKLPQISAKGQNLEAQIDNEEKKFADFSIYSVKCMGGASSKEMFEAKDTMQDSITNLNGAKLEAGQMFLCSKVRLLSASVESDTVANLANADFDIANTAILNGEIEIEVGGKTCLPRTSCRVFDKMGGVVDGLAGCFKLDNPILINAQTMINATIRVNSQIASTLANEAVRLELIGTKVISA